MKLVSILVLVDVGLRLIYFGSSEGAFVGFNPCFSGCWSSTLPLNIINHKVNCFNPCFSGCWSSTLWDAVDSF